MEEVENELNLYLSPDEEFIGKIINKSQHLGFVERKPFDENLNNGDILSLQAQDSTYCWISVECKDKSAKFILVHEYSNRNNLNYIAFSRVINGFAKVKLILGKTKLKG